MKLCTIIARAANNQGHLFEQVISDDAADRVALVVELHVHVLAKTDW
jgi:hypothetical protein